MIFDMLPAYLYPVAWSKVQAYASHEAESGSLPGTEKNIYVNKVWITEENPDLSLRVLPKGMCFLQHQRRPSSNWQSTGPGYFPKSCQRDITMVDWGNIWLNLFYDHPSNIVANKYQGLHVLWREGEILVSSCSFRSRLLHYEVLVRQLKPPAITTLTFLGTLETIRLLYHTQKRRL